MLECIVRGAILVDGTGLPRRKADIGINDGRVVAVGRIAETRDAKSTPTA